MLIKWITQELNELGYTQSAWLAKVEYDCRLSDDLESLCDNLNHWTDLQHTFNIACSIENDDLPTFLCDGYEPKNTAGVFSYDDTHKIVQGDSVAWEIIERD